MSDYDVLIVGGGIVGMVTALSLERLGLMVALVESGRYDPAHRDTDMQGRFYAISPGNMRFLSRLGAMEKLASSQAILAMHIAGEKRDTLLEFSAYEACMPALGYIVSEPCLKQDLHQQVSKHRGITLWAQQQVQSLIWSDDEIQLTCQDRQIRARLLVAADGASSWCRRQAGLLAQHYPYHQNGVVANFRAEQPLCGVARQWFLQGDILAWLPIDDTHLSMVWSTRPATARELLGMSPPQLSQTVAAAGGYALGDLELISHPHSFALNLMTVNEIIAPRFALVGDAAHLMHPLAGQGMNIGLHDVVALEQILADRGMQTDVGDAQLLQRYQRARQKDIGLMQLATDGLQRLFANQGSQLTWLRNWGMKLTNQQSWLKKKLMAYAMT